MKTILAPGLKSRMLGLHGWYSTNILGNRDGEVLDDPESFKTKEESKLSVLEYILQPDVYPQLYKDFSHVVRINYYPPRGDNKEGWDNIDIFGWLGYPMQIKIDFLCRDSILAAPIVLDLALFLDLAQRGGMKGTQEWLSFYFKSPMTAPDLYPEHDIFIQLMKLKNTLRHLRAKTSSRTSGWSTTTKAGDVSALSGLPRRRPQGRGGVARRALKIFVASVTLNARRSSHVLTHARPRAPRLGVPRGAAGAFSFLNWAVYCHPSAAANCQDAAGRRRRREREIFSHSSDFFRPLEYFVVTTNPLSYI